MLIMLSAMPVSVPPWEINEDIKVPANAIMRDCLSIKSLNEAKAKIFSFIDRVPQPFSVIQADILEGRKPNGFSEAVKEGVFGKLVFVTRRKGLSARGEFDGKKIG